MKMKDYLNVFIIFLVMVASYLATSFIVNLDFPNEIHKSENTTGLYSKSDDIKIKIDWNIKGLVAVVPPLLIAVAAFINVIKKKKHEIVIKDDVGVVVKLGRRRKRW